MNMAYLNNENMLKYFENEMNGSNSTNFDPTVLLIDEIDEFDGDDAIVVHISWWNDNPTSNCSSPTTIKQFVHVLMMILQETESYLNG